MHTNTTRNSTTVFIALVCLACVSTAGEIPPILMASDSGVQLWSKPLDAPRDGMLATSIYLRTEDPSWSITGIDRLRIENIQQLSVELFGTTGPPYCGHFSWTDCSLDSSLAFTNDYIISDNFNIAETNDGSYGDLGLDPLPTTATFEVGTGSISMTSPLEALTFKPEFQLNEVQIAYVVTQRTIPTTTISMGALVQGVDATQSLFFDSVAVSFVPEGRLTRWYILAALALLRFRCLIRKGERAGKK